MKQPSKIIRKERYLEIPALYNLLNQPELDLLREYLSEHKFSKGEMLFAAGTKLSSLYYLHQGKIKIERSGVESRVHITRMLNKGEFFGMQSYFAKQRSTCTAIALENCTVYTLPFEIFERLLFSSHQLGKLFLEIQAKENYRSQEYCINLTQKQVRGRLASTLLMLLQTYGFESDGKTLNVYLCREDLANLSNMTNSNAIRTLSSFANEQLLHLEGRKIKILNLEALRVLSQLD